MILFFILVEVVGDCGLGEGKGLVFEKEDKGGGWWVWDCVEFVWMLRLCWGGEYFFWFLFFNLMIRGFFLIVVEFFCVWCEIFGLIGLFFISDWWIGDVIRVCDWDRVVWVFLFIFVGFVIVCRFVRFNVF